MPKAPSSKAQAKPALTQRKLPSKAAKKGSGDASPTPSSPSSSGDPTSFSLDLDKELVMKIILAKLEANKTCDWYQMSQRLKAEGEVGLDREDLGDGVTGQGKGKGRGRGKGKQKGKRELSGTDLHDLYHNKILPALKNGRALWVEDGEGCDRRASTSSTSASSTAGVSKAISGLGLRVNTKNETKPKTKQRLSRGDEEDELDSSDDD
ncbi:hypothetical protein B9479_002056 [Cryptococcus floricola]|uniref:Uncharacterized protein n=1 Tax=Cryptococcus floricola TaxID=2591691 RepID=A0A5D3B243_9TREE|nr:hypothetical protein B9479_002056 [Cryptococcus floricola]